MLQTKLARFARSLRPLVLSDYDGTLARIGTEPSPALPLPRAATAMWHLTRLPGLSVAILSGRTARQLSLATEGFGHVWRVSEQGTTCANPEGLPVAAWPRHATTPALSVAYHRAQRAARGINGMMLEPKRHAVALHTRRVPGYLREKAIAAADSWGRACAAEGLRMVRGCEVVEVLDPEVRRLPVLLRMLVLTGADFTVYAGDSPSDEECVREMSSRANGLGVWVRSDRHALPAFEPDCIVDGPNGWAALLERLHALRRGDGA